MSTPITYLSAIYYLPTDTYLSVMYCISIIYLLSTNYLIYDVSIFIYHQPVVYLSVIIIYYLLSISHWFRFSGEP